MAETAGGHSGSTMDATMGQSNFGGNRERELPNGTVEEQLRRGEICQVGEGLGVPVLAIIDSGVVGVSKPAAEIFHHALDPLGVAPQRALYVGDTVRYDVRGARAAGLVPVHFDPFQLCLEREDHAHVRRLSEVEGLL